MPAPWRLLSAEPSLSPPAAPASHRLGGCSELCRACGSPRRPARSPQRQEQSRSSRGPSPSTADKEEPRPGSTGSRKPRGPHGTPEPRSHMWPRSTSVHPEGPAGGLRSRSLPSVTIEHRELGHYTEDVPAPDCRRLRGSAAGGGGAGRWGSPGLNLSGAGLLPRCQAAGLLLSGSWTWSHKRAQGAQGVTSWRQD